MHFLTAHLHDGMTYYNLEPPNPYISVSKTNNYTNQHLWNTKKKKGKEAKIKQEEENVHVSFFGVRGAQSLVFCVVFCTSLLSFYLLVIVLSVLRFTAPEYSFGIFKLYL
jgi:hypothetical protein